MTQPQFYVSPEQVMRNVSPETAAPLLAKRTM